MFSMSCPYCGHSFEILRDTLLIDEMDAASEKRLRSRTYFSHVCSKCRRLYSMGHPFIFRSAGRFVIALDSPCVPGDFEERVFACDSPSQFYELYAILKDKADWKTVLWLEKQLKQNYNCDVVYESFDGQNSIYYFYVGDQIKAVKFKKEQNKR